MTAQSTRLTEGHTTLGGGAFKDMIAVLKGGEAVRRVAEEAVAFALARSATPDQQLTRHPNQVQLLAPVPRPRRLFMTGANYEDHLPEARVPSVDYIRGFFKLSECVIGPLTPIVRPTLTKRLDYEIELAVVIGSDAYQVDASQALRYVAGYTLLNDVSARDLQAKNLVFSKSLPTFAPMGPVIVTPDEFGDPGKVVLETRVNGELRQHTTGSKMIFGVEESVAFWSHLGLHAGDVISLGTPGGTGLKWGWDDHDHWLMPGDRVQLSASKIGTLENPVVDEARDADAIV
jgi:acylpyruvate hydrolase